MGNRRQPTGSGRQEEFTDPRDEVIDEFLEGAPRADQWREYREVLSARYREAVSVLEATNPDTPGFAEMEKRVRELREQVQVLAEEEAVTQFVEDSVLSSLARPRPFVLLGDDDEEAGY